MLIWPRRAILQNTCRNGAEDGDVEDDDEEEVDVDLAVEGLLENRGHRRRIRFKPSAARPVLHFRQSKSAVPDRLQHP